MADYSYGGVKAALARMFQLAVAHCDAGQIPINPDDLIKATRMSGDSDRTLELMDLFLVVSKRINVEEYNVLRVEYMYPNEAITGPRDGENKLSRLQRECRLKISEFNYFRLHDSGLSSCEEGLWLKGWIPEPTRSRFLRERVTTQTVPVKT